MQSWQEEWLEHDHQRNERLWTENRIAWNQWGKAVGWVILLTFISVASIGINVVLGLWLYLR